MSALIEKSAAVSAFVALILFLCALPVGAASGRQEIVFIDGSVSDSRVLADAVRPGVEVVRLDAGRDGVAQIGAALSQRRDLKAVHLISHGAPGRVFLGSGVLCAESLPRYREQLRSISRSLGEKGDLLLYGCDVAKGVKGKEFVGALARATSLNVAASTDRTGSAARGGNWGLEASAGAVSVPPLRMPGYRGLLGVLPDSVMTVPTLSLFLNRAGVDPDSATYYAITAAGLPKGDIAVLYSSFPAADAYVEFLNSAGGNIANIQLTPTMSPMPNMQAGAGGAYIAGLGNGNAFIFYGGADNNSYFAIIGPGGPVKNETLIRSSASAFQAQEMSNGNVVVTSIGGGDTSYIDVYTSAGVRVGSGITLNNATFPWVAANGSGRFIVPYNDLSDSKVHAQIFNNDGTVVGPSFDTGLTGAPWAVNLSNGNFVVLCSHVFRVFQPDGNPVGAPVDIGGWYGITSIVADTTPGQEGFAIFTADFNTIWAVRFDNSGNITVGGTQTGYGALAIDNTGQGVKVYDGPGGTTYKTEMSFPPWQGYAGGVVAVFPEANSNDSVLQTWAIPAPASNHAPTLTASAAGGSYSGTALAMFSGAAVSAGVGDNLQKIASIELTVSGLANGTGEILNIDGTDVALTNGTSVTTANNSFLAAVSNPGAITVTLTHVRDFDASLAQTLVDSIKYRNSAGAPTGGTRTVTLTKIVDNGGTSAGGTATTTLNIAATAWINTVPSFLGAGAGSLTVPQGALATDIRALLHVSDTDASQTESWTQSAAPAHGALSSFAGVTAASGSSDIITGSAITYTPTAGYAGSDNFSIQVSDGVASATRLVNVTVSAPTVGVGALTLNAMTFGSAFSTQSFTGTGGFAPYTYSVSAGSLPAGLALNSSTGALTGTPTSAGAYSFTIQAMDSSTGAAAPFAGSRAFSGTVGKANQTLLFSQPAAVTFGSGTVDLSAYATAGASTSPVSFSIVGGTGSGSLSGTNNKTLTITAAGSIVLQADQAADGSYNAAAPVQRTLTVNKAAQTLLFSQPAAVSFGSGTVDLFAYATAGASTSPVIFSIVAGGTGSGSLSGTNNRTLTIASAGTIVLQADQAADANYNAATAVSKTLTVNKAAQTLLFSQPGAITFGSGTVDLSAYATAGASPSPVTFSIVGGGTGSGSLSGTNNKTLTVTAAGTIILQADQAADGNYNAATAVQKTLTVNKASQTITFNPPATATLGDPAIDLAPLAVGGASGMTVSFAVTGGPGSISGATLSITGAGSIEVTASQAGNGNYLAAADVVKTIATGKTAQSITLAATSAKTYGDADFGPGGTVGSGLPITYSSDTLAVATITSGGLVHIVGAGTAIITASQAGDATRLAATAQQTLTVSKAVITVTADNKSRDFGAADPVFSASYSGFVIGENASVITGFATFSTDALSSSPVGNYTITPAVGALSAANYSFTPVNGTLTVGIGAQSITFNPLAAKTYGDASFTLSATGGASGNPVTFTSSNTAVATVSGTTVTIVGAGSTNIRAMQSGMIGRYASASAQQTLTVGQAVITVRADDKQRAYNRANPPFTASYSGYLNGDDFSVVSGAPSFSTGASQASPSGSYPISIDVGGLSSANYRFLAVDGTLAIDLASQSVAFGALSAKRYGEAPFDLSAVGGGSGNPIAFSSSNPAVATVNGSTVSIVGAGSTTITASQAGNANYASGSAQQALTVDKATLTVSAMDATRAYHSADPVFGVRYAGFVNGDDQGSLLGAPMIATGATLTSPVGSYPITVAVGNLFSNNYAFAYLDATLTVNQATATVILENLTQGYDGSAKTPTATTVPAGLALSLSYDGNSSAPSAPGSYLVLATVSDANYTGTGQATLTIAKNSQTITFAAAAGKRLGDADFDPGASASSGLPLTYTSSNPAVAAIANGKIHLLSAGVSVITASQAGNAFVFAAAASQTLTVDNDSTPPGLRVSAISDGATTTDSTQNISGTVSDRHGIRSVTVNGVGVQLAPDGTFSFPVQLLAGVNTITVSVVNNVGIGSTDTRRVTLDSTAPKLSIAYPPDNALAMQRQVTVTGSISTLLNSGSAKTTAKSAAAALDPTLLVTYSINGSAPQAASQTDTTYSFTTDLDTGMNTVKVFAVNLAGQKVEAKRTLGYQPAFSLAVTDPPADIRTVMDAYTLTGKVADNTSPVGVTITMDGQSYHPEVVAGVFRQQLNFSGDKVYQVAVTGVDQNNASLTVQRNVMHSVPTADAGATAPFTIVHALQALQVTVGILKPDDSGLMQMDVAPMVNGVSVGDGKVDIEDAVVILRMAVGLIR